MSHEPVFYWWLLAVWVGTGMASLVALLFKTAPYGRFARAGWGPGIGANLAWMLMESPAAIVFFVWFVASARQDTVSLVFVILWSTHYIYRGFLYPARLRSGRRVPVAIVLSAIGFNFINGYLQARYLFTFAASYPISWLRGPWFLGGLALFVAGFAAAVWTDGALRALRSRGEDEYTIPHSGLFRWVSCPNYLGEIVEWNGWALLTCSPAGAAFAFWTVANLAPRALAYHRWYREQFDDYPGDRKALVPYLL
jgi:3-oxo-5-alpha-steroid 4-dehydrogenase 1